MATESPSTAPVGPLGPDWVSGAISGLLASAIVGVIIYLGFDAAIIEESIPDPFGQSGAAIGWVILLVIGIIVGLVYAALNSIEQFDVWASTARTGASLGVVYGMVLWVIAITLVPFAMGDGADAIGDYAVSVEGILAFALLGAFVGFLYLLVPVLRTE